MGYRECLRHGESPQSIGGILGDSVDLVLTKRKAALGTLLTMLALFGTETIPAGMAVTRLGLIYKP